VFDTHGSNEQEGFNNMLVCSVIKLSHLNDAGFQRFEMTSCGRLFQSVGAAWANEPYTWHCIYCPFNHLQPDDAKVQATVSYRHKLSANVQRYYVPTVIYTDKAVDVTRPLMSEFINYRQHAVVKLTVVSDDLTAHNRHLT